MELEGTKILILVQNEHEDSELQYPKFRLQEAGAKIVLAGPKAGEIYHGKHGVPCKTDISFQDVKVEDFDGIVIPGGYAPDKLRVDKKVLEIVKKFHEKGKLIAFICHAGWVPISAGILDGVKATSVANIKDDMVNAGVNFVDEAVVQDRHFISSRTPDDLTKFCPAIINYLQKSKKKQYALT